jgi:RNA polymerase sigma-70 factor (ECF subfamily)
VTEDLKAEVVAMLPRLRAFARALEGGRTEADDLVQATCEKAIAAISRFERGTRLDSWMFRIMHNHFIDGRRARRPHVSLDASAFAIAGDDGRRVTEGRLVLGEATAAIAALPDEQRAVLVLVCVEGLRYRETAEVLGVPIGTVMSRLARARAAVAAAIHGTTPDQLMREGQK